MVNKCGTEILSWAEGYRVGRGLVTCSASHASDIRFLDYAGAPVARRQSAETSRSVVLSRSPYRLVSVATSDPAPQAPLLQGIRLQDYERRRRHLPAWYFVDVWPSGHMLASDGAVPISVRSIGTRCLHIALRTHLPRGEELSRVPWSEAQTRCGTPVGLPRSDIPSDTDIRM